MYKQFLSYLFLVKNLIFLIHLLQENNKTYMLFGHGDNGYQHPYPIYADFSTNVYYKGTDKKLTKHLKKKMSFISKYPEVAAESLTKILAKKHQLSPDNFLITNGATEAFYLIASLKSNANSEIFIPSFAEYNDACTQFKHQISFVHNNLLKKSFKSNASYLWICNPNNPDGKIITKSDLTFLVANNPKTTIILDEAYKDFTLTNTSLIKQLEQHKNLILVHSLTKKYAIPGLRLGYIIASKEKIKQLLVKKQPWTVNSLAIEAGKFLMQNTIPFNTKKLITLSLKLQKDLSKIKGITVIPSTTSYFLIQTEKNAKDTVQYLVKYHGILLRNASNFKSLNYSFLRISTRSKKDNKQLVKAITQWMNI